MLLEILLEILMLLIIILGILMLMEFFMDEFWRGDRGGEAGEYIKNIILMQVG